MIIRQHRGRTSPLLMLLLRFNGEVGLQPPVDLGLRSAPGSCLGKFEGRQASDAKLSLEAFGISEDGHGSSLPLQREV